MTSRALGIEVSESRFADVRGQAVSFEIAPLPWPEPSKTALKIRKTNSKREVVWTKNGKERRGWMPRLPQALKRMAPHQPLSKPRHPHNPVSTHKTNPARLHKLVQNSTRARATTTDRDNDDTAHR